MVTKEEAGAPFQVTVSPQIKAMAAFQINTAFGKLKAVTTPTVPNGFHTSIMKWSFLYEFNTLPLNNQSYTRLSWTDRKPYHRRQLILEPLPIPKKGSFPFIMKLTCQVLIF
jgi:hypothetical protein